MPIVFEILWVLLQVLFAYVEALVRLFVPPARKNIAGKVVLITGAGRGIGRHLAFKFAKQGAKLAVWDILSAEVEETARLLTSLGTVAHAYTCDVTSTSAVHEAGEAVRRDLGRVDILINNAGILIGKELMDLSEKEIRRTMEINTLAHFWTIREFLPSMLQRNSGHVVTIASMAGKAGTPLLVDYSASKFGAYGLTEALASELRVNGKTGVKTTTVCPMFVNTNLLSDIDHRAQRRDRFGKMLEPEEVAEAVLDGVLRNQIVVYAPSHMKSVDFLRAMPYKAQLALGNFADTRFVPADKNK